MKYILMNFLSIVCVSAAAVLAFNKINGWGWFLLLAFCSAHVKRSNKDEPKS